MCLRALCVGASSSSSSTGRSLSLHIYPCTTFSARHPAHQASHCARHTTSTSRRHLRGSWNNLNDLLSSSILTTRLYFRFYPICSSRGSCRVHHGVSDVFGLFRVARGSVREDRTFRAARGGPGGRPCIYTTYVFCSSSHAFLLKLFSVAYVPTQLYRIAAYP